MKLSKLEKVDLREVWKHEAINFTKWLAEPENLGSLSDEIGIDISFLETEKSVGSFNVDIYAEEESTGRKIVIENQLESTDHDHLGKIITYASGLDAEIIIWIVKSVRDEHKQAVDWLNEHTDSNINFFAIQMEVWRIGESPCAPKFYVIAKPNDWAKAVKKASNQNNVSNTKLLQLQFWDAFKEFALNKNAKINLRMAKAQHWYSISFGSSNAHIGLTVNSQNQQLGCEIYILDSKPLFDLFYKHKSEIEAELGLSLIWDELPQKKASRIKLIKGGDFTNQGNWNEYHAWLLESAINFHKVFGRIINNNR
ncbi:MAG: DUF4268 domain-containing protein [Methylococcales bacterium]|nr:DUF4268 domain-containing protein [Methylococcales bacterium]